MLLRAVEAAKETQLRAMPETGKRVRVRVDGDGMVMAQEKRGRRREEEEENEEVVHLM